MPSDWPNIKASYVLHAFANGSKGWLIEFYNSYLRPSEVILLERRGNDLKLDCSFHCCIEVPALVLYVEVWMRLVMIFVPIICYYNHVDIAHEFLTQQVCTVISQRL